MKALDAYGAPKTHTKQEKRKAQVKRLSNPGSFVQRESYKE
jgi:hypothetical protein